MTALQPILGNSEFVDLTGRKFGMLTVLYRVFGSTVKGTRWMCRCECGNLSEKGAHRLKYGIITNCGCMAASNLAAAKTRHGMCGTPTYYAWLSMQRRCYNKNSKDYASWGARGIRVCDLWRWSFDEFFKDMGEKPAGMQLDRIDNDGNYCPMNCRWASRKQQCRNTRRSIMLTFNGKTMALPAWVEETGIPWDTLWYRVKKGWPIKETLTLPMGTKRRGDQFILPTPAASAAPAPAL